MSNFASGYIKYINHLEQINDAALLNPQVMIDEVEDSYHEHIENIARNIVTHYKTAKVCMLAGPSSSGKTTTAQAIIGLLADNARRDAGKISLNGEEISRWSAKRLDTLRGARISLVPQDPGNSLNPVKTIGAQVGEIVQLHQKVTRAERDEQVLALLEKLDAALKAKSLDARRLMSELDELTRGTALAADLADLVQAVQQLHYGQAQASLEVCVKRLTDKG